MKLYLFGRCARKFLPIPSSHRLTVGCEGLGQSSVQAFSIATLHSILFYVQERLYTLLYFYDKQQLGLQVQLHWYYTH